MIYVVFLNVYEYYALDVTPGEIKTKYNPTWTSVCLALIRLTSLGLPTFSEWWQPYRWSVSLTKATKLFYPSTRCWRNPNRKTFWKPPLAPYWHCSLSTHSVEPMAIWLLATTFPPTSFKCTMHEIPLLWQVSEHLTPPIVFESCGAQSSEFD